MNKYSSKAVKTAATVGMSLAMVLSAVPAVGNAVVAQAAITTPVSARTTAAEAQKMLAAVLEEITDYADLNNDSKLADGADVIATISDTSTEKISVTIADGTKLSGLKDITVAVKQNDGSTPLTNGKNGITDGTKLEELAQYLVANSYAMDSSDIDEDVIDFAKFIKGYTDGVGAFNSYLTNGALKVDGDGAIITTVSTGGVTGTSKEKENIVKIYRNIIDNEKYLNAALAAATADTDLKTFASFKDEVKDYLNENEDVYNKEYVKQLEDTILVDGISVYDAVEKGETINYSKLSKVEKVLKDIKNDDDAALKKIAKYADVKEAEEVAAYIDGLDTIVTEMKEVKDLLKSTNADVKAYKKDLAKKVSELVAAAKTYATTENENNEKTLNQKLNAFREADVTALKDFVEDYIGQFYTLTPKQLSSGKYVVRLANADYGRYVTNENVFDLLESDSDENGLQYLLTTTISANDSADTYYDTLVTTVTTVEELLKAVTTDIDGITMSSTLTDKQAAKIVAARKALNQLVTDGKIDGEYSSALTSKEKKAVLANAELIETLYFKLIMNGTVTASGWVDKGNGEWDYIAEDGSRPTKWIASGANWYYVKNGTMLRNSWIASDAQGTRWYYVDDNGVMVSNTTVNGYTFNSYGVWVK